MRMPAVNLTSITLFILFFLAFFMLKVFPKDLSVRHDLSQKSRILHDSFIHLVQFLLISELAQELAISYRKRVEVFSTPVVCGELGVLRLSRMLDITEKPDSGHVRRS